MNKKHIYDTDFVRQMIYVAWVIVLIVVLIVAGMGIGMVITDYFNNKGVILWVSRCVQSAGRSKF